MRPVLFQIGSFRLYSFGRQNAFGTVRCNGNGDFPGSGFRFGGFCDCIRMTIHFITLCNIDRYLS